MSFLANIFSILTSDIRTTIISLIIGYIVYKIAKFYVKRYSLPPGPTPLPLVGNMLYFRGTKEHWSKEFEKIPQKYGPIFTFYLGKDPFVVIRDADLARDTFRRNEFSGRIKNIFADLVSNEKHRNIVHNDYGHTWEALRRVAHSAVQKYATTDKLVYLATDCVDQTIDTIIQREGFGKPFVPFDYIYHMFLNILATSAFGRSYDMEDKEYKQLKYIMKDFFYENKGKFFMWEFMPLYKLFDYKKVQELNEKINDMIDLLKNKFKSHYKDYSESVIRDFCDTLITAKNEALKEGKESAPYLTDTNLGMVIFDVFFAGTDTSQETFRWLLLLMTYYPKIGQKLRQEIESEIGDRMPTHEDRNRCHYVMAFISETMRARNMVPSGVPHKAVVTSKIGEYTIPKDTAIIAFQGGILNDKKYWKDPEQFNPERFLENGEYITTRPSAFIPFGVGRRVCLGEKLAIADLFLVLVRFIQRSSEYDLSLHSNDGIDPDPNNAEALVAKDYKIVFSKK